MRLFVTRVSAPDALRDNGTKWQIVMEDENGNRTMADPERVLLRGPWTFARDESGVPTVWLTPMQGGELTVY